MALKWISFAFFSFCFIDSTIATLMNKMETCTDGRICEAIEQYSDPCIVYFCDLCFWATPNCPYDIKPPSAECQVAFCEKGPTPSGHGWKLPFIVVIVLFSFFALVSFCGWKYRQRICALVLRRSRNGDELLNNDDDAEEQLSPQLAAEQLSQQSRYSSEMSEVELQEEEEQQQHAQQQQPQPQQQQQQQQQQEQGEVQTEPTQSTRLPWMRRIRRIWR